MQRGGLFLGPNIPEENRESFCIWNAKTDNDLELQGVYRNDKAERMACFRDCLAECTPNKCMAWRRMNAEHGYCVFIGCSWRERLGG